jgi:YD repeat-containing protein
MKNIRTLGYLVSAAVLILFVSGLISPGLLDAETVAYTYDANGRMLRATYGTGQTVIHAHTFDKAGNLLTAIVTGALPPGPLAQHDYNGDNVTDLKDLILGLQVLSGSDETVNSTLFTSGRRLDLQEVLELMVLWAY